MGMFHSPQSLKMILYLWSFDRPVYTGARSPFSINVQCNFLCANLISMGFNDSLTIANGQGRRKEIKKWWSLKLKRKKPDGKAQPRTDTWRHKRQLTLQICTKVWQTDRQTDSLTGRLRNEFGKAWHNRTTSKTGHSFLDPFKRPMKKCETIQKLRKEGSFLLDQVE